MSLAGKRILVMRTRAQASELAGRLQRAGAIPVLIPALAIEPPDSFEALDRAIAAIGRYDWLILTSANAVQALAQRASAKGVALQPQRIAVIGPATARAVDAVGLQVHLMPEQAVAEALAERLLPHATGASMLLVRAEQARDVLPERLTAVGADLTIVPAYRTVVPRQSGEVLKRLFAEKETTPDAAVFTSSSTVTNLVALLEAMGIELPETMLRASIGPITSKTLREAGLPPDIEAEQANVDSLCEALERLFR